MSDDDVIRSLALALSDRYDVPALVNLVRIGHAALAAEVVPSTAAVEAVRRARILRTGARFLRDLGSAPSGEDR